MGSGSCAPALSSAVGSSRAAGGVAGVGVGMGTGTGMGMCMGGPCGCVGGGCCQGFLGGELGSVEGRGGCVASRKGGMHASTTA